MGGDDVLAQAFASGPEAFTRAARQLTLAGPAGEALLIRAVAELPDSASHTLLVAIGDASGPDGADFLRGLAAGAPVSSPHYRDVAVGCAKRVGADASAELTRWFVEGTDDAKWDAMICLAGVGDDRAWDLVFTWLGTYLPMQTVVNFRTPYAALSINSKAAMAIAYLARHVGGEMHDRRHRLVGLIRKYWTNLTLTERDWLVSWWPAVEPSGPPAESIAPPDSEYLSMWASIPSLTASDPT